MPLPSLARWRTRMLALPRGASELGELTLAGTIANSAGISWKRPRVFGQWAFVYLVAGSGRYRDERGVEEHVNAGNWILVSPEVAHAYGPGVGEKWNELYVCFRGTIFESWRAAGYFNPRRPVGRWAPVEKSYLEFRKFFQQAGLRGCSSLEAVCAWQVVLAEIFQHVPPFPGRPSWLEHALNLFEKSGDASSRRISSVARECGLGYESFRKKFEAAMGQPPGRYALGRRIERARQLISMARLTNKELADQLGFHDEFHFSKAFSRFTGATPREFRIALDARREKERNG